jgi:cytochrome b
MTDQQLRGRKRSRTVLTYWHDGLGVAFVVAYVTAEGFLRPIHRFAGYVALAAILLRLLIGGVAPVGSPFRLPRPSLAGASLWWSTRQGRHPLYAWIAAFLLFGIGLTAVTGLIADAVGLVQGAA